MLLGFVLFAVVPAFAQDMTDAEYRPFPMIGSRNAAWIAAQLHLVVRLLYPRCADVCCYH